MKNKKRTTTKEKQPTMKERIIALDGQNVAVCFKGAGMRRPFQVWGVCKVYSRPFAAIVRTFKGKSYALDPLNVDFIVKMKCRPEEVDY